MIARTQNFIIAFALAIAMGGVGSNASASEFDPKTGELVAPEMIVVREDAQGNRVVLTLDKAPSHIETEAQKQSAVEAAEVAAAAVSTVEGGAEGSSPKEFDKTSATAAWYYWYYPSYNNYYSYNCYYTYGNYYYRPVTYYNYGYYNYYYYRRW